MPQCHLRLCPSSACYNLARAHLTCARARSYGYWYNQGLLYPDLLSAMVALEPATRANGCLQLLSGTQRMGRLDHSLVVRACGTTATHRSNTKERGSGGREGGAARDAGRGCHARRGSSRGQRTIESRRRCPGTSWCTPRWMPGMSSSVRRLPPVWPWSCYSVCLLDLRPTGLMRACVCAVHALTLHASSPNTSDVSRWALTCCYNTRANDPIEVPLLTRLLNRPKKCVRGGVN
eukprot:COSAG01_NODE_8247_length_2858_cov_1.254078_4_plen_234_part_00